METLEEREYTLQILPVGSYQANCYLVLGKTSMVLIDPGAQGDRVVAHMKKLGKQLEYIFITHGHHDHVGALNAILAAYPGCPVYIHKEDAKGDEMFPVSLDDVRIMTYKEGDAFTFLDMDFHVLHTPGHSKGSVTLLYDDVLFTGDTLFAGSIGRTDFEGGNYKELMKSLARLSRFEGSVFSGHGGDTTMEKERETNPYLQEAMRG